MRIAAGVLILVVAAMNLIGGCSYTVGGGMIGGSAGVVEEIAEETAENSEDPKAAEDLEKIRQGASGIKAAGGSLMLWGVFLLVLAGLQIAAGVQLFRAKGAALIKTAAGLEILSDVVTVAWFGTFIMALLGLVAAIMAIVSVKEFSAAPAPVAESGEAEADSGEAEVDSGETEADSG